MVRLLRHDEENRAARYLTSESFEMKAQRWSLVEYKAITDIPSWLELIEGIFICMNNVGDLGRISIRRRYALIIFECFNEIGKK